MAFKTLPSNFESFQGQTRGPGEEGGETPEYNDWGKRVLGAGGTIDTPESIGFLNGTAYSNLGQNRYVESTDNNDRPIFGYTPFADDYFEQSYSFMPPEQVAAAKAQSYRDESGNLWIPNNFHQRAFYESPYQNKDSWLDKLMANGPMIASAAFLGPSAFGAMGAGALSATEAATLFELTGLPQYAAATGAAAGAGLAEGGGTVAGSMPESYWNMLADNSGAGGNVSDLTSSNWYDSMTPQDLGQEVNPWTTNPSFADLGGTAGAAGGATGIAGLLQQLSSLSGLTTDQLTRLGGAGISSLASMYGASKLGQASMNAANRVATANQSATQLQSQMYQDQVARQQPFYQAGLNALPSYTKGVMPGGDLVRPFSVNDWLANQDPARQVIMDEMGRATLHQAAAGTGGLSGVFAGNTAKALQDRAGQQTNKFYSDAYNRYVNNQATQRGALGNLAGFAPPAAAAMGAAGSNYGTNVNNLATNTATTYGNADMTGAAARQSAYTGAGGAFANALSPNPLNAYLNKQLGIA